MVGHTIAEIFGHILFSFTRSVAEHSNFPTSENHSSLFGYNALEDTGKEWYAQSVDEVIYQEYSNSETSTSDYWTSNRPEVRIINASSTDDSEQTREEISESAMAWKHLRPSIFHTVLNSMYFGLFISVLSASIAGPASIAAFYFSFQTQPICLTRPKESIPIKLQWVITISEVLSVWFMYFSCFLSIICYFRPFQISGLKSTLFFLCFGFYILDSGYRITMQALGLSQSRLTSTQKIPAMATYHINICVLFYVLTRHLNPGPIKRQIKTLLLLIVACVATQLSAVLVAYLIYPAYNKQEKSGKLIIAIFSPLIVVLLKGASRVCVQRSWNRISYPSTSFVLLGTLYCGSATMLRLLQVDLQSLGSVAFIGVIHGIAEVIERSTMVIIDHYSNQILEKRKIPLGGFRTPRRERLAADICIMSMLYESSAIISVNGLLYLYQYFYTSDNSPLPLFQLFVLYTSLPLSIEWFFTSVSIAIETRYQNMPIMAVWRRRWKRHVLVAVINIVMISIWASTSLLIAIRGRFVNETKDHCKMPFNLDP